MRSESHRVLRIGDFVSKTVEVFDSKTLQPTLAYVPPISTVVFIARGSRQRAATAKIHDVSLRPGKGKGQLLATSTLKHPYILFALPRSAKSPHLKSTVESAEEQIL